MVLAQTDVDKTNRSYYGETTMYMLGSTEGVDFRVPLGMVFRCPLRRLKFGKGVVFC